MKIGVNLKLDVKKLDKARFFQGKKGTYCDLTAFIDTEQVGEYGDNGTISQSTTKEERENALKMPIIGNVRVFYVAESSNQDRQPDNPQPSGEFDDSDDIPF